MFSFRNAGRSWKISVAATLFSVLAMGASKSLAGDEPPTRPPPCEDIQTQIDRAVAEGESKLVLPKGVRCASLPIKFSGVRDFDLDGAGATLVFTDHDQPGIWITDQTQRLTIRNLTLDYFPLPFTQGVVTQVSGLHAKIVIDRGYPSISALGAIVHGILFDPATRQIKDGVSTVYIRNVSSDPGGRAGTLLLSRSFAGRVEVGDLIVLNPRGKKSAIEISGLSRNIKLDEVAILSSPGMGVFTRFADGSNEFKIQIKPGPRPSGAVNGRLLSTNTDGFNYAYSRGGPIIEKSEFSGMGDDGINLHALVMSVAERQGKNVVIAARPFGNGQIYSRIIHPRDRVRFLSDNEFSVIDSSKIKRIETINTGAVTHDVKISDKFPRAKFDKVENVSRFLIEVYDEVPSEASYIDFPDIGATGFIIRDSVFKNSRGHAIVSGASNGIIEGNDISGMAQNAIVIGPSYDPWREGSWVERVIIRNNKIKTVCMDPNTLNGPEAWALGAITIGGHIAPGQSRKQRNAGILLEGNALSENGCEDLDHTR